MRTGLYPGTFDPVTLGHSDIIRRACALVDKLVIGNVVAAHACVLASGLCSRAGLAMPITMRQTHDAFHDVICAGQLGFNTSDATLNLDQHSGLPTLSLCISCIH